MKLAQKVESEKATQRRIVQLFTACGGVVYNLSQGYRKEAGGTRQTPGLPDLYVFFARRYSWDRCLWWEVKRPGGKRTEQQLRFAAHCAGAGIPYGFGGFDEAMGLMARWGLVRATPRGNPSLQNLNGGSPSEPLPSLKGE